MKTFFSKAGQALMLPIALLPAAGIMLGIGGSFTNASMIESYGLESVLGNGTLLNSLLQIMTSAGDIVFANLPVLFAIGIAVGFARKEKGAAALAAIIGFLIMNVVMAKGLELTGYDVFNNGNDLRNVEGQLASVLGIQNTLQMGVFGGIISGFITSVLHNKFIDVKVPAVLGFFGGARLIPILASFAALFYGMLFIFIWPPIGDALSNLGNGILSLGAFGSFLFGIIERSLIPFGLHHVFYMPLWQTSVGGTAEIAGQMVYGTQNQFFAYLAAGQLSEFTSTNFMSGKFPFMIFGLPGAAYAMYRTADVENKKEVAGLLFSIAFTSMLTGITEPIEFTFLFIAPFLYYGIHVPLAGLSFMLMDLLHVKIGMTFSGGLIDYTLFGLLPQFTGQDVNALMVIVVGIPYFFIYFFIFRWAILKWDIKTPGRGGAAIEAKTKADYKAKKAGANPDKEMALEIIEALGGAENIELVDACITRLRVQVKDANQVKDLDFWTQNLAARGLVKNGNGIQAIYGNMAAVYKSIIAEELGLD